MNDITNQVHQVFESYGLTITAAQAAAIVEALTAIVLKRAA